MRLKSGVYYYDCEEYTYLRNVADTRDYLLSPICYDILSFLRSNPGCTETELCRALAQVYEVEDFEAFREDIGEFLRKLAENQLLEEPLEAAASGPDISDRVEQLCREQGRLYSATLELTYRCNEKCIHCYVDDGCPEVSGRELTLPEYRLILDQLKAMGCIHLLITGGEVCLRKDFLEIASEAVDRGFLVDVYTNGIAMTDEQFDRLCEMRVNSVSFSLYSGDAEVHDAITKVKGSFEKTLKRVMMFKCAGVDTFIKTVVIRQNLDSLEGLFRLGKRLGIPVNPATSISDSHLGASRESCRLQDQAQRLRAAQLIQGYDPVERQDLHRDPDASVCRAGITTLSIDPYGGVHPCLAFTEPVGSVRKQPLEAIWREAPLMKRLRTFRFRELKEDCGSCQYADTCGVCIGSACSESGGKLCPNTDTCQWSKAKYDAIHTA